MAGCRAADEKSGSSSALGAPLSCSSSKLRTCARAGPDRALADAAWLKPHDRTVMAAIVALGKRVADTLGNSDVVEAAIGRCEDTHEWRAPHIGRRLERPV